MPLTLAMFAIILGVFMGAFAIMYGILSLLLPRPLPIAPQPRRITDQRAWDLNVSTRWE